MPSEHEPRIRELIHLIVDEADSKVREKLGRELEELLNLQRKPRLGVVEIPAVGYLFRED